MDAERLRKIDLFASLSDDELDRLVRIAHDATVEEGASLVKAGRWQVFAHEQGSVDVRRDDETIATLKEGDVVGETGAVERQLRNATVVATTPLRVIFFTQADIDRLRREIPDLDERLQQILRQRGG